MRGVLALLTIVVLLPRGLEAQWASWQAYIENDTFAWPGHSSDRRYTNGLRWTLATDPDDAFRLPLRTKGALEDLELLWQSEGPDAKRSWEEQQMLTIGQNTFTPTTILNRHGEPFDRPFVGLTYVGLRSEVTQNKETLSSSGFYSRGRYGIEVILGWTGPLAAAQETQAGFHVLRTNRLPDWRSQLGWAPPVVLQGLFDYDHSLRWWKYFEVIPTVGFSLGNFQNMARGGATLRIGTLSGFPTSTISNTVLPVDESSGIAVFASREQRLYGFNLPVDGRLFQDDLDIERVGNVGQWRFGVQAHFWTWRFTYSHVRRDDEFRLRSGQLGPTTVVGGRHNFGSVSIGRSLIRSRPSPGSRALWIDKWWLVDVAIGRGWAFEGGDDPGRLDGDRGIHMRIGLLKGIDESWFVGGEISGTSRFGPEAGPSGWRGEAFARSTALILGYRSSAESRWFFRAGGGTGRVKEQEVRAVNYVELEPRVLRLDEGKSVLASASWAAVRGTRASISVDGQAHFLFGFDENQKVAFFTLGIGFKWHP